MFHDPYLERVTNGTGLIKEQAFVGNIDQLLTTKQPSQPIPTFEQTIDLLMQPEAKHVKLNIDCKADNDGDKLFNLLHTTLSKHPNWEDDLAPRMILGLWHPKFIEPAKRILPSCPRIHIGFSPVLARKFFWESCSGFSINYASLAAADGELFRKECKAAGKSVYVWTVNARSEMIEATKWGVQAILTDRTADFLSLRSAMQKDFKAVCKEAISPSMLSSFWYYEVRARLAAAYSQFILTRKAGPMTISP